MVPDEHEALRRLRDDLESRTARALLRDARVLPGRSKSGALRLQVRGAFEKQRLESSHPRAMERAFGRPVEVVHRAKGEEPPVRRRDAMPQLHGPAGRFALQMLRAFVDGGTRVASLVVLHGPSDAGKTALVNWAAARGGGRVFRLDLERLRQGRARGLVPRKPLVVADGIERLAGGSAGQRTLCGILEAVLGRGDRVLVSVRGHPAECRGLDASLRTRLLGGVLVPLRASPGRDLRSRLAADVPRPADVIAEMKDVAARLFDVERTLLDGTNRRRQVVAARRTVIAAARRQGLGERDVTDAFGFRSERAVRDACQWARVQERRDTDYAALLHEVGRVIPRQ